MDFQRLLLTVLASYFAYIAMGLLLALVKRVVQRNLRLGGLVRAIGLRKGSKLMENETTYKGNYKNAEWINPKMAKNVRDLTVFVVRGNFYDKIGKENGPIFFIEDQVSGSMTYLFRVFGEDIGDICQYIGVFTGKLTKNISFLPGCDVIYIGNFPVETEKYPHLTPVMVSDEVIKMAEICGKAQILEMTTSASSGLGINIKENDELACGVAMTQAVLKFIDNSIKNEIVDGLKKWPYFLTEPIDDYLISFAVNQDQTKMCSEAIVQNDLFFRKNQGLYHMLGSVKRMKNGAMLVLYPRNGDPGEIVGCAAVHPMPTKRRYGNTDLRANVLLSVWVCEELRGRGYGKKLVKRSASICKGTLITFLPFDDEDETFDMLKFFRACGCRNSIVNTTDYFGPVTESSIGLKLHRIAILDDLSETV